MPTAGRLRIYGASLVSDAVLRRMVHAGLDSMRVQSVYRSVVNIATTDGLLSVASPEAGGLPNGIVTDVGPDWRVIGLQPGMVVHTSHARIRVPAAGLEIDLETAARWSPRFQLPDEVAGAVTRRWRRRTAATWGIARVRASARGFGPLLRSDADLSTAQLGTLAVARPVVVCPLIRRARGRQPERRRGGGYRPDRAWSGPDAVRRRCPGLAWEAGLRPSVLPTAGSWWPSTTRRSNDGLGRHAPPSCRSGRVRRATAHAGWGAHRVSRRDDRAGHRPGGRVGRDERHGLPARRPDRPRRRRGCSRDMALMSTIHSRVFRNSYRDSVELMQIAAEIESLAGIDPRLDS